MKRTIIDQIEITRKGHIGVRFHKQVLEDDGETVISSDNHRCVLEIGCDIDKMMLHVNAHLVAMKCAPVSFEEYQNVKKYAAIKWTPELIAAWQEEKAAIDIKNEVAKRGLSQVVF